MKSVKSDAKKRNITFERVEHDFWAYNYRSIEGAYWTGYYTTHPDFKHEATVFSDYAQFSQ